MMTHGVRWSSDAYLELLLERCAMCRLHRGAVIKAGHMQEGTPAKQRLKAETTNQHAVTLPSQQIT